MSPTLSAVIPCYNEAANIPLILERFKKIIAENSNNTNNIEVILVNNGSRDESKAVLDRLLAQYPFARTVEVKVNQGYGFGILAGLREAKGEFLGWTHADLQTDPGDILKALEILKAGGWDKNLFVKGRRRGRPLADQVFTVGMSAFETLYMGRTLVDINAQPNIFHRDFFKAWKNPPHDFSLDLYAFYMAKTKGLKVIRFDVHFAKRIHGQSHWNTGLKSKWKFIKRTLDYSLRLKRELKTHAVQNS